jgi:two-component system cell cycle response regulator DivK
MPARERKQCLVLIVEDSATTYELYSEILASAGYAVVGADSGQDAYDSARQLLPDLIVMDYELKGIDGAEAARLIKTDVLTRDIPIVMVTGKVSPEHLARARSAGCDSFLMKPCSLDQLLDEAKRNMRPRGQHGGTILVIEDDDDICAALSDILRAHGFTTDVAHDGQAAIDYLRQAAEVPRLILLDLMLPVMDGWAFRAAQLEDPRLAPIPVVVLSAAADLMRHAAELHVEQYLNKPVDVSRLLHAIERHF